MNLISRISSGNAGASTSVIAAFYFSLLNFYWRNNMALTLATVETAIEALLSGGQSVSIDGMSYTQASLTGLIQMRKELRKEAGSAGHKFGYSMMPLKPPGH